MTFDQQARRHWYNYIMNVTARGFQPGLAAGCGKPIQPPPVSDWTWTFSEDCPKEFIALFKAKNPIPNFIANPANPHYGTWGEVSVWKDKPLGTGYINSLNYDSADVRTLTFSYDVMKNGKTTEYNAFTATAIKVNQLKPHLREIWLDGYDPKYEGLDVVLDDGSRYSMLGACSSIRTITAGPSSDKRLNFHGRNFDFTYDDRQTYLIHVRNTPQTLAFNCVVKDMFKEGTYTRLLPNMAVDGINQNGVCVNINVVSKKDLDDMGEGFANVNGTNPGATKVHMLCMPSVILAHATSAVAALKIMSEANIYGDLLGLEHVHFMISDKEDTFVVEVIGDKLKIKGFSINSHNDCGYVTEYVGTEPPIMTNWYICDDSAPRFPPGKLVRGAYTKNACGIERFDVLSSMYGQGIYEKNEQRMTDMLSAVKFTNQADMDPLDDNYPFSDFGFGADLTKDKYLDDPSSKKLVDDELAKIRQALENEDRTKGVWITSHSVVYDLNTMTMKLMFEEDFEHPMRFDLWLR